MTGAELFEALSFVDGKYIQEAETANLGRNTPWMKVLSVAACLCILLTGAYALSRMQSKGATESMAEPEAAAPEAMYEEAAPTEAPAATEAVAAPRQEAGTEEEAAVKTEAAAGELEYVPFAHLRILEVRKDGSFLVFVERVADEPGPFEAGAEMTLVIDPNKIPVHDRSELPYDGTVTADMLVEIQNGAYDAGANTLYAEGVLAAAQE